MQDDRPFTTTSTDIVYQNPWIKLREDKVLHGDGQKGLYAYIDVTDSVNILAINDKGEVCIVESYRQAHGRWAWELPGGNTDGEDELLAAQRELQEETGIVAQTWHKLGRSSVYSGLTTEMQHMFVAKDLTYGPFAQTEEETRSRRFVSFDELEDMIRNGTFEDGQSMATLFAYKCWIAGKGSEK